MVGTARGQHIVVRAPVSKRMYFLLFRFPTSILARRPSSLEENADHLRLTDK